MNVVVSRNILMYFLRKCLVINTFYFKVVKPSDSFLSLFAVMKEKKKPKALFLIGHRLGTDPGCSPWIHNKDFLRTKA